MDSPPVFHGGCFCGATRYIATGQPWDLVHCHCADCRRASGAAFVTWATFRPSDFLWEGQHPTEFRYEGRIRQFCGNCGSALTFRDESLDEIDVTVCTLDHPEQLLPTDHTWTEDQLPWIHLADGLPHHRRSVS